MITAALRNSSVCIFFLNGNCRYGEECRFAHSQCEPSSNLGQQQQRQHTEPNRTTDKSGDVANTLSSNHNNNTELSTSCFRKWLDVPEFVPRALASTDSANGAFEDQCDEAAGPLAPADNLSYAEIVSGNPYAPHHNFDGTVDDPAERYLQLCPYFNSTGNHNNGAMCPYGEQCEYSHGDMCDMCGLYCLHPTDEEQRKKHKKVWIHSLRK